MDQHDKKLEELSENYSSVLKNFNDEITFPVSNIFTNQTCITDEIQKDDNEIKVA